MIWIHNEIIIFQNNVYSLFNLSVFFYPRLLNDDEFDCVLDKVKNNKASAPNGLSNEFYICYATVKTDTIVARCTICHIIL